MVSVTLDTNVYISALLFGGKPLELLDLASEGRIRLSISQPILAEVISVMRDKFGRDEAALQRTEQLLLKLAERVTPSHTLNVIKHDDPDNRVLECAAEARSEYIASGDGDLLTLGRFGGASIVRVADLLDIVRVGSPTRRR